MKCLFFLRCVMCVNVIDSHSWTPEWLRPCGTEHKCQSKSWVIRKIDTSELSPQSDELARRSQSTAFCFTGQSHHLAAFQLSGYKNIDIWNPEYMFICDFLQQNKTQFTVVPLSVHSFLRLHPHLKRVLSLPLGEEVYTHYNTKQQL